MPSRLGGSRRVSAGAVSRCTQIPRNTTCWFRMIKQCIIACVIYVCVIVLQFVYRFLATFAMTKMFGSQSLGLSCHAWILQPYTTHIHSLTPIRVMAPKSDPNC